MKTPEVMASGVVIAGRSFLELAHPFRLDPMHDHVGGVYNAMPIRGQVQAPSDSEFKEEQQ